MRRRFLGLLGLGAAVLMVLPSADAVDPPSGAVSPAAPTVTFQGDFLVPGLVGFSECDPLICEAIPLTVDLTGADAADLEVEVTQADPSVPAVVIRDAAGTAVAEESGAGSVVARVEDVAAGAYTVEITNGALLPAASYTATATLVPRELPPDPATIPSDTVEYPYDAEAPVLSTEVPLRVVMVGFEPGDVSAERIFAEIPDHQRVGSLYTYDNSGRSGDDGNLAGLETLLNHGRIYYRDGEPNLLPIEYRWRPELHYAPNEFAQGLFDHMVATSTTGDFANPVLRAYLELYNATRGIAYRALAGLDPARIVPPGQAVRFVDGESTEDWIAANAESYLGFPAGRDPGQPGYTVFVLNTWDAPEASAFPPGEYHVFRINRVDPDRGDFDGVDWGRVWGGRYRFMLLDLGAAPNAYESETWANRARSVTGSALYDPPLWEYRANAPRPITAIDLANGSEGISQAITLGETWDDDALQYLLARTVNEAVNFRFFHSYLYEPRPGSGRFFLSDNVWHHPLTIYQSDLERLYDQEAARRGLSTLTPYFEFDGDVVYEYLADVADHPEYAEDRAALEAAMLGGDDVAGVPLLSMNTATMMDYIDSHPDRFLRGGPCATTVPTIQVVVPGHFAWALPIAAGIATNRAGVPWGFLNSVNDVTKWNGADKDQTLVLAHPNIIFNGVFTYTTIHEASHYLGLAHPHDTIGAIRGDDGEPVYYDGFAWTFNTTASPTTYSHVETVYSILDQESIARGHASYYVGWAQEALQEAGAALVESGMTTVGQLAPDVAAARATAIAAIDEAKALFSAFRFVDATFAAQRAWHAAADVRDVALALEPGTSEVEHGTQTGTDAELAAAGCAPEAALASAPEPLPAPFDPGPAPLAGDVGASPAPDSGTSSGTAGGDGHTHDHGGAPTAEPSPVTEPQPATTGAPTSVPDGEATPAAPASSSSDDDGVPFLPSLIAVVAIVAVFRTLLVARK